MLKKIICIRSIFTINGTVNKWFADFGPSQWIIGKTAKFPINEPIFDIEIIDETSSNVSGPVGYVLFCSCRSFELIVAQPCIVNNENIIKLPDLNKIFNDFSFRFTIIWNYDTNLQLIAAKICLKTGKIFNILLLEFFNFKACRSWGKIIEHSNNSVSRLCF